MFVHVAVNIPTDRIFTYQVPPDLVADTAVGKRVLVPFGRRNLVGCIVEKDFNPPPGECKDLFRIIDSEPLFAPSDLAFYRWLSSYYLQPLGKVLAEVLPPGITPKTERLILPGPACDCHDLPHLSRNEALLMAQIEASPDGVNWDDASQNFPQRTFRAILSALLKKGLAVVEEDLKQPRRNTTMGKWVAACEATPPSGVTLTIRQRQLLDFIVRSRELPLAELKQQPCFSAALLTALRTKGVIQVTEKEKTSPDRTPLPERNGTVPPVLNREQADAATEIRKKLVQGRFSVSLLHGVTGSGKTEVYLNAMAEAVCRGGSVLYLVPEISLTAQLEKRVRSRFPQQEIAVWHSDIPEAVRRDYWRRIRRGDITIVVGARSALFAPLNNLKLIVVDEEHDDSYKQDDRTRYHGRDAAVMRGKLTGATVVLGSATPALQTCYHARAGKYTYLSLPERIGNRPLPEVEMVSLFEAKDDTGAVPLLSPTLVSAMSDTLSGGGQTLLFLNRRGFHTFLFCPECRQVLSCPNCAVSLTYHGETSCLHCHYCDYQTTVLSLCPACGGGRVLRYGAGTERLEQEVKRLFPQATLARMDRDSVSRRGKRDDILKSLEKREIDILVGTQMITKGHDFPHIRLVGVIAADLSLNVPDFRAAERTFQLLTQVSGRSGRGETPGRVIVQTLNPDHYAIARAKNHDYLSFYEDEIALRRTLGFPPFSRMITLHLSATHAGKAEREIGVLKERIAEIRRKNGFYQRISLVGPIPAPIAKIRGRYRWQILLKGREIAPLHDLATEILHLERDHALRITADVDPVNFM
jgi:primosomal protein N' (replication factor Y)